MMLDKLAAAGVDTAVVNVHYLASQLEDWLGERKGTAPAIVVSDERDALLDTGGGVTRALPKLGPGPFFVHNADTVWSEGAAPALTRMLSLWDPAIMDCLLLLAPLSSSTGYWGKGDFAMSPDGRLIRRGERQVVPFAFAGVSLCDQRLFVDAAEGEVLSEPAVGPRARQGAAHGVRLTGTRCVSARPSSGRGRELVRARRCLTAQVRFVLYDPPSAPFSPPSPRPSSTATCLSRRA